MSEHAKRKNARALLARSGYSAGGHLSPTISDGIKKAIHEHEAALHHGKPETRLKLKSGGCAEGYAPGGRLDKAPRKGKGKASTKVNVIVAPQAPAPHPMGLPPMGAPPAAAPPMVHPAAPPMAGPPGGMPLGAPPAGVPQLPMKPPGLKKGGKAPKMTGSAGNGVGRLEKAEAEERRTTPEKDG
jgi:hypothetical protein